MIYLLTDWLIDLPCLNKQKLVEVPQTMNNREKTETHFPILKMHCLFNMDKSLKQDVFLSFRQS